MPEIDPLILSYSHLADLPRANEALHALKKIASLVKPLMRARGWTVRQLAEFYPEQPNLLGLNVGKGQKICLRLRYPGDRNQFLPIEQVTDTMLHELSHNVHGPHDAKFHALWDQLRDEHEALAMKGYTGEGFMSDGYRLGGGGRIPMHEARRLARAAAEKRRVLSAGSGQRLGGTAPRPGQDIRRVIVDAVERRNKTIQGCASSSHNQDEIREIAEAATRNGFKTQAEEDAANEAAIAQALWELVQEEQKAKYGGSYIPPTAENPIGNGGRTTQAGGSRKDNEPLSIQTSQMTADDEKHNKSKPTPTTWACEVCTLENPLNYLCCDACGSERSGKVSKEITVKSSKRKTTTIDLIQSDSKAARTTSSSTRTTSSAVAPPVPYATRPALQTWTCSFCGRVREKQWWSCDLCGKIKDSS